MEIISRIANDPEPGKFYRIQYGDTLLGVAGKAFGVGAGQERLEKARLVNDCSYNDRFRGAPTNLFPAGQISFNPKFTGDPHEQANNPPPAPSGHDYAILWIPREPGHEPDDDEDDEIERGDTGDTGDEDEVVEILDDYPKAPAEPLPLAEEEDATRNVYASRNLLTTIDHQPGGQTWFSS